MQRNNNNSRASFLRKVSLGMVSVLGLGWAVMSSNSEQSNYPNYNLISDEEANDLIKNMPTSESKSVRPLPPPINTSIKGE